MIFIFDQIDMPYCIGAMVVTSADEDDYKTKVLVDFILHSIQFEENE